jgi:hypothetical protein
MAWIKFEKDRLTDPRMLRMARRLCERGLRYPFAVTQERHDERDMRYAITLLAGAWLVIWVYADTHIGADDSLQMGVADVDRIAGIEGFCELAPSDWLEIIDADSCVKLPGYQEHNGVEQRRRDQAALRMQRHRERKRNDVQRISVTDASPDKTRPRQEKTKETPLASRDESRSPGDPVNGNAVAYIPIQGGEFGVSQELSEELARLYPKVDVPQTLNEIRGYNISNPTKRKTRSGVLRHINTWMAKEQNRGA